MPKGITKAQKRYLKKIFEDSLNKNSQKGKKKSFAIAKASFYNESFKIFLEKEGVVSVSQKWKRKKQKGNKILKEDLDYKSYKINDILFITSTDKKIFDKFSESESSGMISKMKEEFDMEVLFKVKGKYNIKLDPEMFYVIKRA